MSNPKKETTDLNGSNSSVASSQRSVERDSSLSGMSQSSTMSALGTAKHMEWDDSADVGIITQDVNNEDALLPGSAFSNNYPSPEDSLLSKAAYYITGDPRIPTSDLEYPKKKKDRAKKPRTQKQEKDNPTPKDKANDLEVETQLFQDLSITQKNKDKNSKETATTFPKDATSSSYSVPVNAPKPADSSLETEPVKTTMSKLSKLALKNQPTASIVSKPSAHDEQPLKREVSESKILSKSADYIFSNPSDSETSLSKVNMFQPSPDLYLLKGKYADTSSVAGPSNVFSNWEDENSFRSGSSSLTFLESELMGVPEEISFKIPDNYDTASATGGRKSNKKLDPHVEDNKDDEHISYSSTNSKSRSSTSLSYHSANSSAKNAQDDTLVPSEIGDSSSMSISPLSSSEPSPAKTVTSVHKDEEVLSNSKTHSVADPGSSNSKQHYSASPPSHHESSEHDWAQSQSQSAENPPVMSEASTDWEYGNEKEDKMLSNKTSPLHSSSSLNIGRGTSMEGNVSSSTTTKKDPRDSPFFSRKNHETESRMHSTVHSGFNHDIKLDTTTTSPIPAVVTIKTNWEYGKGSEAQNKKSQRKNSRATYVPTTNQTEGNGSSGSSYPNKSSSTESNNRSHWKNELSLSSSASKSESISLLSSMVQRSQRSSWKNSGLTRSEIEYLKRKETGASTTSTGTSSGLVIGVDAEYDEIDEKPDIDQSYAPETINVSKNQKTLPVNPEKSSSTIHTSNTNFTPYLESSKSSQRQTRAKNTDQQNRKNQHLGDTASSKKSDLYPQLTDDTRDDSKVAIEEEMESILKDFATRICSLILKKKDLKKDTRSPQRKHFLDRRSNHTQTTKPNQNNLLRRRKNNGYDETESNSLQDISTDLKNSLSSDMKSLIEVLMNSKNMSKQSKPSLSRLKENKSISTKKPISSVTDRKTQTVHNDRDTTHHQRMETSEWDDSRKKKHLKRLLCELMSELSLIPHHSEAKSARSAFVSGQTKSSSTLQDSSTSRTSELSPRCKQLDNQLNIMSGNGARLIDRLHDHQEYHVRKVRKELKKLERLNWLMSFQQPGKHGNIGRNLSSSTSSGTKDNSRYHSHSLNKRSPVAGRKREAVDSTKRRMHKKDLHPDIVRGKEQIGSDHPSSDKRLNDFVDSNSEEESDNDQLVLRTEIDNTLDSHQLSGVLNLFFERIQNLIEEKENLAPNNKSSESGYYKPKKQTKCKPPVAYFIPYAGEIQQIRRPRGRQRIESDSNDHHSSEDADEFLDEDKKFSSNSSNQCIQPLEEFFFICNPRIAKNMQKRAATVNRLKSERIERAKIKREWIRRNQNAVLDPHCDKMYPILPPKGPRLMTSEQMKQMTKEKYHRLPEVTNLVAKRKQEDFKRTNRLMSSIFSKKLSQRAKKGGLNVSHNSSIIGDY